MMINTKTPERRDVESRGCLHIYDSTASYILHKWDSLNERKKLLEHVFLVHWNCRLQTLYVKFNCCPSERNLSLSKRCRAGKQEAYQIVIKTNFCISSWAFWLTVVCHMKNIIIKIFLVFCRFGADTTTKRRLLQTKWVGTIISTLTTNTWFVITTHTQLSQQLIHRCGYTFGGGGNARSCLSILLLISSHPNHKYNT